MRRRIERRLERLGTAGVLGLGVLLACAGFYVSALIPAERELTAGRAALERLGSRSSYRVVSTDGGTEDLYRFYGLFPTVDRLADELERVMRLARAADLDLAQGEYRLERGAAGLASYRVTLPVRGSYPQIRDFLASVLRKIPTASVDTLRFERKKANDARLEAQIRLTLHFRPSGETP
jgi:hypothetical protein